MLPSMHVCAMENSKSAFVHIFEYNLFHSRLHIYLSEKTQSHFISCHSQYREKVCHLFRVACKKINLWHQSPWIKPFILGLHKHFISRKEQLHSWAPSGAFVQRRFWQGPNQTRRQRRAASMLTVKLTVPLLHKTGQQLQRLFQKKMMAWAFLGPWAFHPPFWVEANLKASCMEWEKKGARH